MALGLAISRTLQSCANNFTKVVEMLLKQLFATCLKMPKTNFHEKIIQIKPFDVNAVFSENLEGI